MSRAAAPLLLAGLLAAAPAAALVVDGRDSSVAERPPPHDPGWAHVGSLGAVSAIYLGDGWILTASHAGMGPVKLDGVSYPPVPESRIWLDMPGQPGVKSDLALFRIHPAPPLPRLEIQQTPPTRGSRVLMIGMGHGRGEPVAGAPPIGYAWRPGHVKRWGTNRVSAAGEEVLGPGKRVTRCFSTDFSRSGTRHEAQAAVGDSGGAVFVKDADGYRLAGVMISIHTDPGQPERTALYGNATYSADLSAYGAQIQHAMRAAGRLP